jgi:prepilin-type N-terminal cleavage/methylation domain-containing protein
MQHAKQNEKGFTLIELLLVIAIIGVIATVALVGQSSAQAKRRDVKRVANIKELQSAMALYLAKVQTYVVYTGCLTGADPVTTGLVTNNFIGAGAKLTDPKFPSDVTKCYYYDSNGSKYTLRYTLEQDSAAGAAGNHTVVP